MVFCHIGKPIDSTMKKNLFTLCNNTHNIITFYSFLSASNLPLPYAIYTCLNRHYGSTQKRNLFQRHRFFVTNYALDSNSLKNFDINKKSLTNLNNNKFNHQPSRFFNNTIQNHQQYRFYSSSFISQVMAQVKKELETNEALKQSMKDFENSSTAETSTNIKNTLHDQTKRLESILRQTQTKLIQLNGSIRDTCLKAQQYWLFKKTTSPLFNETIQFIIIGLEATKRSFCLFTDALNYIVDHFLKDDNAEQTKRRAQQWRQEMELKRRMTTENTMDEKEKKEDQNVTNQTPPDPSLNTNHNETTYDLIVSQKSAWDRFGTHLRDMPFLLNFFENTMVGKLFGETTQAAALREMKSIDPNFKFSELVDLMEHVIAPHLLQAFLLGDKDALKRHCGQAAYAAAEHSIRERETLKLFLDPSILLLRNVEFRGASSMPESSPWFIFTFSAQQINCLRDSNDHVVIGAIDDIHEVTYSVALRKHPELEHQALEYPWQITEFAVIENTPCW